MAAFASTIFTDILEISGISSLFLPLSVPVKYIYEMDHHSILETGFFPIKVITHTKPISVVAS